MKTKQKIIAFYIALIFIGWNQKILAQSNYYFRPLFSLGLVGNQIDGDNQSGYNKVGPNGGIYINRAFSEKNEFEFGLTYIQKGARKNIDPEKGDYNFYKLRLNYVEVPFLLKHNIKKYKLEIGASAAYLFKSYEESNAGVLNIPFRKLDISYNIGLNLKLNENWIAGTRISYSIIPIRTLTVANFYYNNFMSRVLKPGFYTNNLCLSLNYIINKKTSN